MIDYSQCYKISLEQMYYFITVADEKNVSKAADRLFISQPFLSKNIMKLESLLNTSLFERSRTGFVLTSDGEILYKNWKKVLSLYSDGLDSISSEKKINLGILDVYNPIGFIKKYITENISKFNIKTDDLYQLYTKFKHCEYDAIITQEPFLPYISLNYEKKIIAETPMTVICHKDNPLSKKDNIFLNDLCNQTIILYCSNLTNAVSVDDTNKLYFDSIGINMPNIIFTDSFSNALLDVSLNNGFCFCDSLYTDESILPPELVMKDICDLNEKYYLCYHKESEKRIEKLVNS